MIPYPDIDPVALALGPIKIHWYGLTYIAGLAFAWWFARHRTAQPHSPLRRDQVDDLIFYAAVGIVLGGRLGYAFFYGFDRLLSDPLWLLRVWEGGMAFHGGLIGVLVAMAMFARQRDIDWGRLMDFVAPLTPVGLALGRCPRPAGKGARRAAALWPPVQLAAWGGLLGRLPLQVPSARAR